MANTQQRIGTGNKSRSSSGTSTATRGNMDWLSTIRKNKMTIGVCLLDTSGEVVAKVPISGNQIPAVQNAGVNLRNLERWTTGNLGGTGTTGRRAA